MASIRHPSPEEKGKGVFRAVLSFFESEVQA